METKRSKEVDMEEPVAPESATARRRSFMRFFTARNLYVLVVLVLLGGLAYYYTQYQKLAKSPADVAKEKVAAVVKEISQFALVPNDPNAQLATVTDVTKLKGQPFFENAQNGDEIVVFPTAMEAILYRPSIHKIIDISRLAPNTVPAAPAAKTITASTTKKK